MSADKRKYFEVVTSHIVRANNMRDAVAATKKKKVTSTTVLFVEEDVNRLSAAEARQIAENNTKRI